MIKTQQKTIYANMEQTGANYSASQSVAPAKQTKHQTQKILLLNSYDNTFLKNTRYHNDQ